MLIQQHHTITTPGLGMRLLEIRKIDGLVLICNQLVLTCCIYRSETPEREIEIEIEKENPDTGLLGRP